MSILQNLFKTALDRAKLQDCDLRIDNIILGKSLYTMKHSNVVFTDMNLCLILLENGYGFSYFQDDIDFSLANFVNKQISEVMPLDIPIYLKVALVDALHCCLNNEQSEGEQTFFVGNLREKARQRAEKILEGIPPGSKILLIGAVTEIIEIASRKNLDVTVTDLENAKIGLRFGETEVKDDSFLTLETIKKVEYVIATGMIFASKTTDAIFQIAQESGVSLRLYMETGSNFGEQLLQYGAEYVLSEYFPYYDFFGRTRYSIFKKADSIAHF